MFKTSLYPGASGSVKIDKTTKDRGFDSYEIKYFSNGAIEEKCTASKYKDLNHTSLVACEFFNWPGTGEVPKDQPECVDGECERKLVFVSLCVKEVGIDKSSRLQF